MIILAPASRASSIIAVVQSRHMRIPVTGVSGRPIQSPELSQSSCKVPGAHSSMADMMKETPMYQSYAEIAPQPEDFPRLLGAIGEFMTQPYDWSDDVQKLKMPVMIAFGDSDMFRPEHMVEFYQLLGGGQKDGGWMGENMSQNRLAILPGATHYNIIMSPLLVPTVMTFLEK